MWSIFRRARRENRDGQGTQQSTAPIGTAHTPSAADSNGNAAPSRDADGPAGADHHAAAGHERPHTDASRSGRHHTPHSTDVDYTVEPREDDTDAGIAPIQDEDDLPARPREHTPLSREDVVADALDTWSHDITGGVSTPSFLTQMRSGPAVLDLTHSHPSGLAQLLAGRGPTRLSSLVREVGALADARAHARTIRETAERHAEEVGLTTCHLGIGEAIWEPDDGSEPIHAPVLIRPITLRLRGNAREDVDLDLDATSDINPVLLRALREAGVAVDARALLATTDSAHGFDPNPVLDAFRALGQPLPGFRIAHALVVGNLMDAAGSVAGDLAEDPEDWAGHDLVAALAGVEPARQALRERTRTLAQDPELLPRIPENDLVAVVDQDHRRVLEHVLAGDDVAAAVAPGTDGLDLVVDLAAELNARGRSVLIVSQRRRNLAQLVEVARQRDLEELVFDLSPDPSLQRNASAALLRSLRRAGSHGLTEADAAEPEGLEEARSILTGHVEAMHRIQQPWGVSAHDAISALAALTRRDPAPVTTVRLRPEVAASMIGEDRARYADALREASDAGVLDAGPEQSAWYGAPISSDTQAERARTLVTDLREDLLPRLHRALRSTGGDIGLREPTTLDEAVARLALIDRARETLAVFQPAVFRAELEEMVPATADKAWRAEHGVTLGWNVRRRLVRRASALQRPTAVTPDLHGSLTEAARLLTDWRREAIDADAVPMLPERLEVAHRAVSQTQRAVDELAVLLDGTAAGDGLLRTDLEEVERRLHALDADADDLADLPRRTTLLRRLDFDGLGELVEDLRARRVSREDVASELELAWWRSVLELIAGAEPTISQYDGTSLSQVAERFRRLDAQYLADAAPRIHAAADEVLVSTMKRYPDTSRAAIAELARSSTVSVRDLTAKYEDILFRARPAWLASPYLVPMVLPRGRHVDVVIIADGGRLPTAAALPAIVRGTRTVVVGDPLEYGGDQPCLLDDMLEIAPHVEVLHDPRPATEGARHFAQRRALAGEVRAMPGPIPLDPDRLIMVDNGRGPVVEGAEYVESTEAELRRVTDLVIEHARTRPERSLAVLTLTPEHARRVMERVMQTVSVIPSLRDFFAPDAEEFFTVVPAVHASSILRDDTIVSIGFGKTPHGRLLHSFGPLSEPTGRKALATVLTRARGRVTVVSSIGVEDLDPARLRTDGARDLRALLWVLRGGNDVPVVPRTAQRVGSEQATPADSGDETAQDIPTPGTQQTDAAGVDATLAQAPANAADAAEAADENELSDDDLDAAIEAALARRESGADAVGAADESADEQPRDGEADEQNAASTSQSAKDEDAEPAGDVADGHSPGADSQGAAGSAEEGVGTAEEPAETADPEPASEEPRRELETDALVRDLADRLARLGLLVEHDFGLGGERIELALGHPSLPGRLLVAVDTDGERYVATASQRERDRLRAERLEAVGWTTERVWSWALFIDPDGEAERIRRAVDRALTFALADEAGTGPTGAGTIRHRLPRPQIPAGHPLSFYASEDFDAVVEYVCSDGRARLEDQLAAEVRAFLGFEQRSVLLDVSVASAIRRYQERQ